MAKNKKTADERKTKPASTKRARLPRVSDYSKDFIRAWDRYEKSGRVDLAEVKKVMNLIINPDAPLPAEYEDHELQPEPVTDEELRQQQAREAAAPLELQQQEARQAFKRQADQQAEEAKKQQEQTARDEAQRSQEGEIANASARYSVALGNHYDVPDPYGSLAKASMAEYSALVKGQEQMRQEAAKEQDAEKRRVIELRKEIEAHDYMAITSERLAGISATIAGREDAPQAQLDRVRADAYAGRAAELREERAQLIAAREQRDQQERQDRDAAGNPLNPSPDPTRKDGAGQAASRRDEQQQGDEARSAAASGKESDGELSDEQRAKLDRLQTTKDYYAQHNTQKQKDRDRGGGGRSGR